MKTIKLKENHLRKISDNSKHNYIKQYLTNLGINPNDVNCFIDKPRDKDEDSYFDLDNIALAVRTAYEFFIKPDTVLFIQVDADTDGYTSSSILINYLKRRFPELTIKYRLHTGKEHGVIVDTVPADANLVIIPDAGSNQYEEQKALVEQGKTVIILDHHEVDHYYEDKNVILVNNQSSEDFENKYMSGAGIVYMFISMMDDVYFEDKIAKDYLDLTAIGIIADAMNMTTLGNNYIAYYGLNNIKSQFIHEIALRQARGIKNPEHLTKIDVAFYIAPVINGVIRSGDPEDKAIVFRAMTEENNTEVFKSTWRGKERSETLYEYAARLAANAKARQDSGKKKSFEWLCGKIEEKGWDKDNVIIVTLDAKESAKVSANITGLIAMELVKYYNKPCLVLRETEYDGQKMFGGSGRNGNFYGLPSLLEFLHNSNVVYYAEGHGNAFGCFLLPGQVDQLRAYANDNIDPQIFDDTVFEVDYWFHTGESISEDMLFEFASYEDLYGNSIPQPKFAFDINFTAEDVKFMGKDKNSVRLNQGNLSFITFSDQQLANKLALMPNGGHAQIVGRPQLNEWMGNISVQIMIDDIEVTEIVNNNSVKTKQKINLLDLI